MRSHQSADAVEGGRRDRRVDQPGVGRTKIDAAQYDELRVEACALRIKAAKANADGSQRARAAVWHPRVGDEVWCEKRKRSVGVISYLRAGVAFRTTDGDDDGTEQWSVEELEPTTSPQRPEASLVDNRPDWKALAIRACSFGDHRRACACRTQASRLPGGPCDCGFSELLRTTLDETSEPETDAAREELTFIVSYLGHNDQDANHAWMVRRIRAVLAGKDPNAVEPWSVHDGVRQPRTPAARNP